jgi:hypothetical protein
LKLLQCVKLVHDNLQKKLNHFKGDSTLDRLIFVNHSHRNAPRIATVFQSLLDAPLNGSTEFDLVIMATLNAHPQSRQVTWILEKPDRVKCRMRFRRSVVSPSASSHPSYCRPVIFCALNQKMDRAIK